jgi:hypothetical protein
VWTLDNSDADDVVPEQVGWSQTQQRNFEAGIGDIQRGMAMGAQSQKEVAMIA